MERSLARTIALYAGVGAEQIHKERRQKRKHHELMEQWADEHALDFHLCNWCGVPFSLVGEDDTFEVDQHTCARNDAMICSWYCLRVGCDAPVHTCTQCGYLVCPTCVRDCKKCGKHSVCRLCETACADVENKEEK